MKLSERQQLFSFNLAKLVIWAYQHGYALTEGESYRPRELAELYAKKGIGIAKSQHESRLAKDFNLFKDGKYLTDTEAHRPLGMYWESLDPLYRWGGNFKRIKDGNHYEDSFKL